MTTWSGERVERAKKMWDDGRTAGEIAAAFQVTRNAIVGLADRRGWGGAPRVRKPRSATPRPTRSARQASAVARGQLARVLNRPAMDGQPKAAPMPLVEPSADTAVTLMARTARQCCWPVGEATGVSQLFCGAGKEIEQSYCPWHRRAAWQSGAGNAQRVLRGLANGQPLAR